MPSKINGVISQDSGFSTTDFSIGLILALVNLSSAIANFVSFRRSSVEINQLCSDLNRFEQVHPVFVANHYDGRGTMQRVLTHALLKYLQILGRHSTEVAFALLTQQPRV